MNRFCRRRYPYGTIPPARLPFRTRSRRPFQNGRNDNRADKPSFAVAKKPLKLLSVLNDSALGSVGIDAVNGKLLSLCEGLNVTTLNSDSVTITSIRRPPKLSKDDLEHMVEEATVDAYGESEQVCGFYTMLENDLTSLAGDERQFSSGMVAVECKPCDQ
jgi:hypothetical protein